ncbi:glutaredoxin family protein [Cellvibrio japonicus]|uniref:Glutaredoxin family protein n=1 Tax=Cellvibrio japonicus (strain Ueda107) TaxID=498211 RepID=B3PFU8_CELJU|nr:glutaredoxin family protein [Cellvibrio japonicus]ACE85550.1 conserved hypothetical protein [Cellvibrio japonicus Ueda107]QEI12313.1 glutaredoxin family protein [Cellvibrio japonicus]QEI15886.1 glutaredoxin family protein [Cellvibrio japonicus]QEI19465.1 glutaredoxin family protein [Cellvibrio japonicus]
MKTLYLYTTSGCHLCELATDILWPLLDELGWHLEEQDIADSDVLIERYGMRIPVIAAAGVQGAEELGWPFDQQQARAFLQRMDNH